MLQWFLAHWGDLLIGFILLATVIWILLRMNKDRKAGGCSGCAFAKNCSSQFSCQKNVHSLDELANILKEQEQNKAN